MPSCESYAGAHNALVLAFDLGTTSSGVAYAVLEPGKTPKVHYVTRFPGQENGDFRIPSVVCYAEDGRLLSVGAEARQAHTDRGPDDVEDVRVFVEWFKFYLCPPALRPEGLGLPPLPPNKTIVGVVAEFLAYLFRCARDYIRETHAGGLRLWNSIGDRIDVVVSCPHGWKGAPRVALREAAILAGVIADTPVGRARLHFISDSEASLYYCAGSSLASTVIRGGSGVMVVDAGGGTVDLTSYKVVSSDPLVVAETAPPSSILQGSTRINARFHAYLHDKLRKSEYGNEDDIKEMLHVFERSVKPTFKNPADRSFVRFGRKRDTDVSVDIRDGRLALSGADVAELFRPSVEGIVAAVRDQRRTASAQVNAVFLVGGFAASPWLYANLCEILKHDGVVVYRPEGHTNQSVSGGAVAFFLKKFVNTRVARMTWGVQVNDGIPYHADNPEHLERQVNVKRDPAGSEQLYNVFRTLILEGTRLTFNDVLRYHFVKRSTIWQDLDSVSTVMLCYRGAHRMPYWMDEDPDAYWSLYTVRADTSGIYKDESDGIHGTYYMIFYDLVLTVEHVGLRAQIAWTEKAKERR